MKNSHKKLIKLILRIAITSCLLMAVFSKADLAQLPKLLKTAKWNFLFVVWAITLFNLIVSSFKMQLILKRQDCKVEIKKIFGASSVTMLYSLILPGVLSTGVKWYILKQHTSKGSNVLSGMVYNQATDIVVRVLLGLVALIVTNPGRRWQLPVICEVITIVIIAGCVLLLNKRTGTKVIAVTRYVLRAFPKMVRSPAETILGQLKVFQTAGWSFHLLMAGINIGVSLLSVVIYICAAKAAGIAVPVAALVWQSSAVYILGRLPISVANLGVREFTLIEFLALYGVEAPAVLLMSTIIFSTHILMAAIGAGYQITWALSRKKSTQSQRKPAA